MHRIFFSFLTSSLMNFFFFLSSLHHPNPPSLFSFLLSFLFPLSLSFYLLTKGFERFLVLYNVVICFRKMRPGEIGYILKRIQNWDTIKKDNLLLQITWEVGFGVLLYLCYCTCWKENHFDTGTFMSLKKIDKGPRDIFI